VKLEIDLVPTTAWGKNLRTQLGATKWGKLRKQVIADQGNVCAICSSTEKLQCHEIWEFNDKNGVQLLKGFQASCSLCHLSSHFGLAQNLSVQGHVNIDNVISHFLTVNSISMKQFEKHKNEAFAIWRERSEREWELNLGDWESLLPSEQ
jgi:hypothetical protein